MLREANRPHARLVGLLATLAVAATISVATSPPTAVAEVTVTLDGHGYGHGVGLSQWGAYGYAVDHGWSSAQILDHYYGGTVAGTVPTDSLITVRLQALDNAQTAVVSASGGLVVDGIVGGPWKSVVARDTSADGHTPGVYSVWARADLEVCPLSTDVLASPNWTLIGSGVSPSVTIRTQVDSLTTTNFAALPSVCAPTGLLRAYRGAIRAINGSVGENRTVNEVTVEHYLRSVIAKEMSPSWGSAGGGKGLQALQAQAVAARSYGLAEGRYTYAKTCDSTSCQVYSGAATRTSTASAFTQVEYPSTDLAVTNTAGVVRRVGNIGGPIAYTMFAASSGGWTAAGTSALTPFPAVVDDGDDTANNPNHNWTVDLAVSAIVAKYPTIGTFTSLTVLARNGIGDWGGRVMSLRITGTAGSITVTGDAFKSAMGLKSNWFNVRGSAPYNRCLGVQFVPGATVPPGSLFSVLPGTSLTEAVRCIVP